MEVAALEVLVELVVEAGQIQVIGSDAAGETAVFAVEYQLLGVGRGTVDDLVQASTGKGQTVDFAGGQQAAFEHLGQQAAVASLDHRQLGNMRAVAKFGSGDLDLGGQAEAAELIGGAAIVLHRQQVGAGAATAGVEFDPKQAQSIEAEADGAFGVARLDVEPETLTPFFAFVLAVAFAEIAIQVDIGGGQTGLAVSDEVGMGNSGKKGRGYG